MIEIEQTNKIKILEELQKNGRASASEIAEKTGLSRQTVTKIISNMEKNKEIWGYTTIFDPKLIGKKPYLYLAKFDFSINPEDFLKKVIDQKLIKNNEEKYEFKTTLFLNGDSDMLVLTWANDIIEAKKRMITYKNLLSPNIKEIKLYDVISIFRNNSILHPNISDEWKKVLI